MKTDMKKKFEEMLRREAESKKGSKKKGSKTVALDAFKETPGYEYEYKDPNGTSRPPGKRIGPMAQDMEKSKVLAPSVVKDKKGMRHVDTDSLTLAQTAALSDTANSIDEIKQRLDALEKRGSKRA